MSSFAGISLKGISGGCLITAVPSPGIFIEARGVLRLAVGIIHNNKIRSFITRREFMSLAIGAFAFRIRTSGKRVWIVKTICLLAAEFPSPADFTARRR